MRLTSHCRWDNRVGLGRLPLRVKMDRRCFARFTALLLACLFSGMSARAQIPILDIINAAVKKVIVATDLEVQRLQTQTIGLQNAQKELENDMAQSELTGITGWVQDQRDLFSEYYQELMEVKNAIAAYEAVKEMIDKQGQILAGYRQASAALGQDPHFSAAELAHMQGVLSGIVSQSVRNINLLTEVITSLATQMDDAARLKIIDEAGSGIDGNYNDMAGFSQQCFLLSLERAKDAHDIAETRALYGVQ